MGGVWGGKSSSVTACMWLVYYFTIQVSVTRHRDRVRGCYHYYYYYYYDSCSADAPVTPRPAATIKTMKETSEYSFKMFIIKSARSR